jgi:hypothetical protein
MRFRTQYGLGPDQLLVLHGEGRDRFLEKLYVRSASQRFFEACSFLAPVVLIAPGYSIYTDGTQCRHWQTYNLKRSAKFFHDANNYGLPCIPWGASNHKRDTDRIVEWLNRQVHPVTHLAVNLQTKGLKVLEENIRFIQEIEATSRRQIHWVVFGAASEASTSKVARDVAGSITFVTGKPLQRGRAGRHLFGDQDPSRGDRQKIINDNVLEQRRIIEAALASRYQVT